MRRGLAATGGGCFARLQVAFTGAEACRTRHSNPRTLSGPPTRNGRTSPSIRRVAMGAAPLSGTMDSSVQKAPALSVCRTDSSSVPRSARRSIGGWLRGRHRARSTRDRSASPVSSPGRNAGNAWEIVSPPRRRGSASRTTGRTPSARKSAHRTPHRLPGPLAISRTVSETPGIEWFSSLFSRRRVSGFLSYA